MKEIEVKAYLKDKESVIKKLTDLGATFAKPIRQVDSVFECEEKVSENETKHSVRIRYLDDGRCIFTAKDRMKQVMANSEYETEIKDGKAMEQALALMGYAITSTLDKVRLVAHYQDLDICLDDVEELGSFIEVEKFSDEDPHQVVEELFQFLMTLGISKEDQVFEKYDTMMEKLQK